MPGRFGFLEEIYRYKNIMQFYNLTESEMKILARVASYGMDQKQLAKNINEDKIHELEMKGLLYRDLTVDKFIFYYINQRFAEEIIDKLINGDFDKFNV